MSFDIESPTLSGIEVITSNGPVMIEHLDGHAQLITTNGWIEVSNHVGSVYARSNNGEIRVTDLDGPVDAKSSNGDIVIASVTDLVQARSSNGDIRIREAELAVAANTANGVIDLALSDDAPGPVMATTSNGRISLSLGHAFSGKLEMRTNENIAIAPEFQDRVVYWERGSAQLDFGDGDDSLLANVNASISVDEREQGNASLLSVPQFPQLRAFRLIRNDLMPATLVFDIEVVGIALRFPSQDFPGVFEILPTAAAVGSSPEDIECMGHRKLQALVDNADAVGMGQKARELPAGVGSVVR